MGQRQREWAKKARAQLVNDLGGKCVDCGRTDDLELDHIIPKPDPARYRRMDHSWRVSVMRKEAGAGLLAVRCSACNTAKGRNYEMRGRGSDARYA